MWKRWKSSQYFQHHKNAIVHNNSFSLNIMETTDNQTVGGILYDIVGCLSPFPCIYPIYHGHELYVCVTNLRLSKTTKQFKGICIVSRFIKYLLINPWQYSIMSQLWWASVSHVLVKYSEIQIGLKRFYRQLILKWALRWWTPAFWTYVYGKKAEVHVQGH